MVKWEDGELITPAKVNEDGTITPAVYTGNTPINAHNLNKAQELVNIYEGTNITANTVEGYGTLEKVYGNANGVGTDVNLFDKDNIIAVSSLGLGGSGLYTRSDQKLIVVQIPQDDKNYTISFTKTNSGSRRYAFANEIPSDTTSTIYSLDMITNDTIGKIIKTVTNNDYKYLLLGLTTSDDVSDLKVQKGNIATKYTPFRIWKC